MNNLPLINAFCDYMELRQLNYVIVLAQCGSFVRAAAELHITQSALSRSILALEDELGVRLFERGRHGAEPTQEGRLFIERSDFIRLTVDGLRSDLALSKKGEFGEVSFGMGPLPAAVFMADLLAELINLYPQLRVRTDIKDADFLLEALFAERIEFFVCSQAQLVPNKKILTSMLGILPLSLYVRSAHPLVGKLRLRASELAQYPFVTGTASAIIDQRRLGMDLIATAQCDDFQVLKRVTLQSDAICLTSHPVVAQECKQGLMTELRTHGSTIPKSTELVVVSLAGRGLSPAANLTLKLLRAQFKGRQDLEH